MKKQPILGFVASLALLMPFVTSLAQETSPTLQPSKTATPSIIIDQGVVETPIASVSAPVFEIEEPFIQSDLSILSGNVQRPNGLFWHNGMVYASCNGDWTIYEIDAETGATVTYIWGVRNAHTLHVEDDENGDPDIWAPDFQTNSLVRVYRRSIQTISTDLQGPWGIAPLNEDFLVTNLLGNNLVRITRSGDKADIATGFRSPAGIVVEDGFVYIANNGSSRRAIEWISAVTLDAENILDTTVEGAVNPLVQGLQNVTGLDFGADGYLYFAYSLGTRGVIGRVDPVVCRDNGGCTNDQVEIVVYTDLAAPLSGLAISPDMNVYTHTIFSPDIYYVSLVGDDVESARSE